ncbi:MAG: MBL fold metallo-hydrolase [Verrucomicrobiales bacterium]|nr:MBL fold metallo-hydrolase [Verrucomicrobiales bacterium]
MIEFAVLGSGSSGNSAVVCCGQTKILVDAGLSARQLAVRMEEVGVDPDSLTAILLTHEHGDHVQGLEVFCRKRSIPVYATVHTSHIVQQDKIKKAQISWRKFEAGSSFVVGDIEIDTFNVPHDAVDPVGFVFRSERGSLGLLSDVGHVTRLIIERLKGVDSLFLESNYDDVMLQNDEKRPWSLKQRISNRHGHLSNKQTAELLKEVASPDLNRVILGHLSSDCNTAEKALEFAKDALNEMGLCEVEVECAERKKPTSLYPALKGIPVRPIEKDIAEVVAAVEADLAKTPSTYPAASVVEAKTKTPVVSHRFADDEVCEPSVESDLVQMELAL